MDIHLVPGVNAEAVAQAHKLDILIQEHHGCKCMTYWIDEERENVFCLIEAHRKEDIEEMHLQAHGLSPGRIIEVDTALVKSILGRVYDPDKYVLTENGLKVFVDPSYRFILTCHIADPILLQKKLGHAEADQLADAILKTSRRLTALYGGREVEHEVADFIASFTSAKQALDCATDIAIELSQLENASHSECKLLIIGGEPIETTDHFFGDAFRFAGFMQLIAENHRVTITSCVHNRALKQKLNRNNKLIISLTDQDERLINLLLNTLEEKWQDAEFDIDDYCKATMMSKSQLYRKTLDITGLSPNVLIKDFRLARAKDLMKKKRYNISQITFDSGFTSPSYFTKCFKKKYGIVPMEYLEQV